jgi:hypothetical protein
MPQLDVLQTWARAQGQIDKSPTIRVSVKCVCYVSRKSQSPASEQQIDDKYYEQNTADTDAATISPPAVTETTPEEENQYYYN